MQLKDRPTRLNHYSIKNLLHDLDDLSLLNQDSANLDNKINSKLISRPGLALGGFFNHFVEERVQVIGKIEHAYLHSIDEETLIPSVKKFLEKKISCVIFSHDNPPPSFLLKMETPVPVLITPTSTKNIIRRIGEVLEANLSKKTSIHGVLLEVFGIGILLKGNSGIGKSETALALIERGHRLISDDIVQIVQREDNELYGISSDVIEHHMEIRGIGIISIRDLFGAGSIRKVKKLELIIELEDWQESREYDRLGLEKKYDMIMGVEIQKKLLPIRPGRNIPILIEIAAKNFRLELMGINAAKNLSDKIDTIISKKENENKES